MALIYFCYRIPWATHHSRGDETIEELLVMGSRVAEEVDFIEELKLRRWAREHYVNHEQRQETWHPVVLDEMAKKDRELNSVESLYTPA